MNRRQSGFTLMEVLLATVLLAGGLTLAFATLRSASAVSQRGESIARHSERVRAVEALLRTRLSSALPAAMGVDPNTQQPILFVGEPQRMRFVADVPDYLGRGGPYLHELSVLGSGQQRSLQIGLTMVQSGVEVAESTPVPPEPLATGLEQVSFQYRGIDPERGQLGDWQPQWAWHDRLPLLVRIDIGQGRSQWPPLVVALPQAGGAVAQP